MSHSSTDKVHPHADPAPTHGDKASARQPQTSVHPVEPEDPKETRTSESQKHALNLNVGRQQDADHAGHPGHQAEEHPATPAGQHATGSFTDRKDRRKSA
ncbi:MAG TPA: hypothetical protein VHX13_09795 [Acidobacteriaceae bacterium]|jgi:hypothetical protein|nr:hypothetical protein [Acidobacteriaceae bacterium]